jgi:hypothetical protein
MGDSSKESLRWEVNIQPKRGRARPDPACILCKLARDLLEPKADSNALFGHERGTSSFSVEQ